MSKGKEARARAEQSVLDLFDGGTTIQAISEVVGLSAYHVRVILTSNGRDVSRRLGPKVSDEIRIELLERVLEGAKVEEVADELGITEMYARHIVREGLAWWRIFGPDLRAAFERGAA